MKPAVMMLCAGIPCGQRLLPPASIRAGARQMASCAWATRGVIANSDAITHDARIISAIFFMRGIMTRKPGPDKPLILMHYDRDDERGSKLVSTRLDAEIAAARGTRRRFRFSLMMATRS